jgi:hypothetical protein
MKRQTSIFVRGQLCIIAGVIAAVIALNLTAFAATVKVKGSEAGTFATANFSFDGAGPGLMDIYTGSDNIGGPFNDQAITEASVGTGSCKAPDGSTGTPYVPVYQIEVDTYHQGQLYSGGTVGSYCASNTGSVGATLTFSVFGGTGKFVNASGSITQKYTCLTLAAGQAAPSNSLALFGACQVTRTGSVTA